MAKTNEQKPNMDKCFLRIKGNDVIFQVCLDCVIFCTILLSHFCAVFLCLQIKALVRRNLMVYLMRGGQRRTSRRIPRLSCISVCNHSEWNISYCNMLQLKRLICITLRNSIFCRIRSTRIINFSRKV